MAPPPRLSILLFQDLPGAWIARGLEHDIAAEGRTVEAAIRTILQIVVAHIDFDRRHNRKPLSAFPPAPERFWSAFSRATSVAPSPDLGAVGGVCDCIQISVSVTHERPSVSAVRLKADTTTH
jgi:hypothetical protein